MPTEARAAAQAAEVSAWSLDDDLVSALIAEASGGRFVRNSGTIFGAKDVPRRVTSPFDFATSRGGPVAESLGDGRGHEIARAAADGNDISLDSATYVLYQQASFIGFHTDRKGCDLNLLLLLSGEGTHFEFFPSLTETPAGELFALAKASSGFVEGNAEFALPRPGTGVRFLGSRLPHQRRPVTSTLLMLSLCYEFTKDV